MVENNCPYCGKHVPHGARQCPACGRKLESGGPNLLLWVPLFFIIGIGLGLMLLKADLLEQVDLQGLEWPALNMGGTNEPAEATVKGGSKPSAGDYQPMLCNRQAAEAVREKARRLAAFRDEGQQLSLFLGPAWEFYSEGLRRSFVETFYEADACLHGGPRSIRFHFHGRLVAAADPENWVRISDGIQEIK